MEGRLPLGADSTLADWLDDDRARALLADRQVLPLLGDETYLRRLGSMPMDAIANRGTGFDHEELQMLINRLGGPDHDRERA